VGVGEVFVEITEKAQFPGSGSFRRSEIGVWWGQKTAPGEAPKTCTSEDQKLAAGDRVTGSREPKWRSQLIALESNTI
jgi:hypothetical protein